MLNQPQFIPEQPISHQVLLTLCENGQVGIIFTNLPGGWWTALKMCQISAHQCAAEMDKIQADSRIAQPPMLFIPSPNQTRQ